MPSKVARQREVRNGRRLCGPAPRAPRSQRGRSRVLARALPAWFAERGWSVRAHQVALLAQARARRSTLLIAPTGAGKTLAGFLPTLSPLWQAAERAAPQGRRSAHALHFTVEGARRRRGAQSDGADRRDGSSPHEAAKRAPATRPSHRRQRQRVRPPNILLTTPEQLALMLSHPDAHYLFARPRHRDPRRAARAGALEARRSLWRSISRGSTRSRRVC